MLQVQILKVQKNAFDGDLTTGFTSSSQNGWLGLELSSPAKITQIGWAQKCTNSNAYILGILEGSKDKSFSYSIIYDYNPRSIKSNK